MKRKCRLRWFDWSEGGSVQTRFFDTFEEASLLLNSLDVDDNNWEMDTVSLCPDGQWWDRDSRIVKVP